MPDRYDTAQVCINGHIITDSMQVDPKFDQNFCDSCGADLISECPNCKAYIRGRCYIPNIMGSNVVHLHNTRPFCYQCGQPYPWLDAKLKAARELAQELENISDDDKDILTQSIDEIIKDTPKTEVAAFKFKKIVSKSGQSVAEAFKNILINVVSETAKKMLWPS